MIVRSIATSNLQVHLFIYLSFYFPLSHFCSGSPVVHPPRTAGDLLYSAAGRTPLHLRAEIKRDHDRKDREELLRADCACHSQSAEYDGQSDRYKRLDAQKPLKPLPHGTHLPARLCRSTARCANRRGAEGSASRLRFAYEDQRPSSSSNSNSSGSPHFGQSTESLRSVSSSRWRTSPHFGQVTSYMVSSS